MILITAADGIVGRHVVHDLRRQEAPLRALVTSRSAICNGEFTGVELLSGDLSDHEVLDHAMRGVSTVVLISRAHPDQVIHERNLIDAALRHRTHRIVKLSSVGASAHAPFRLGRWHWQTERLLSASALEWTVVRAHRPMQHVYTQLGSLLGQHAFYGCQGNAAAADVDVRDVAAMLAALTLDESHHGSVLDVSGPEALTPQRCAALLSKQMGHPVEYVDCEAADFVHGQMAGGVPRWQAEDRAAWQRSAVGGAFTETSTAVTAVTGRQPRTFEAFAAEFSTAVRYANAPAARTGAEQRNQGFTTRT
jgi:uncharacterized protein YbjT (DUF2867 family)